MLAESVRLIVDIFDDDNDNDNDSDAEDDDANDAADNNDGSWSLSCLFPKEKIIQRLL